MVNPFQLSGYTGGVVGFARNQVTGF